MLPFNVKHVGNNVHLSDITRILPSSFKLAYKFVLSYKVYRSDFTIPETCHITNISFGFIIFTNCAGLPVVYVI